MKIPSLSCVRLFAVSMLAGALCAQVALATEPAIGPAQAVQRPVALPMPPPFDEKADAKAAISRTVAAAAVDGIRVLITWGANDDSGSKLFMEAKRAPALFRSSLFQDEYKTVNVDVGNADRNVNLAKIYGVTLNAKELPALTVLDSTGKVLANTNAAALRPETAPTGIDPEKIVAFLKSHQAPAPDAGVQFEASLKKATREGKMVFAWFSAPW